MIEGNLTIGIILAAALVDSINPCVFGVLIFLLAFMTRVFKSRHRMLLGGLWYSAVVYLTYLALGFGILRIAVSVGISSGFYWVAAIIAILAGLLEIKDFFWYGKGFSLQMIPGASERIKRYTQKIETWQEHYPKLSFLFVGILGIFVVLVELPCTGAPYFAVLALLSKGSYGTAIPYLLLYNFVFIIPLLVVVAIAYFGTTSERLEEWRQKHRGFMRLSVGLFLIALGAYMIYSITVF
jgi:cytochrome c biogenesis protein CcdA